MTPIFEGDAIKQMQGSDPSRTLFLCVMGQQAGWFSTGGKALAVPFRGRPEGAYDRSFVTFYDGSGDVDPTLSIFVTDEGFEMLTSKWCGKFAMHWPMYVCHLAEASTLPGVKVLDPS